MNYPFWDVPGIGSAWVIGMIAIYHVMISHFAVGGGLYLPMAEAKMVREGRLDMLPLLQRHAKFFLVLTGVYGAVSGVGIWFAIGLANPEGTSTLIHNFVFGWAIEWVFFIIELSTAAVYYYTWGRIPHALHIKVGYLYAGASIATLVIINGILSFMLTPGDTWLSVAGTGAEASKFWNAFFNPTYWPSLFLRIMVCVSLAGLWALVTFSRIDGREEGEKKTILVRWSVRWIVPSFVLMPVFFIWYLWMVPAAHRDLLNFGISTIGAGTFTQVTRTALVSLMSSATILFVVYFFAYRSPREFTFGHACAILGIALMATGSTESAREMLRKPYVVGGHMYSNGVRKTETRKGEATISDVARFNANGYLAQSPWVRTEEREAWAKADAASAIRFAANTAEAPSPDLSRATLERGRLMYLGQCGACHTANGYRSMTRFLADRDYASIRNIVTMLHGAKDSPYAAFMPPAVGTEAELDALAAYLYTLNHPDAKEAPRAAEIAEAH